MLVCGCSGSYCFQLCCFPWNPCYILNLQGLKHDPEILLLLFFEVSPHPMAGLAF